MNKTGTKKHLVNASEYLEWMMFVPTRFTRTLSLGRLEEIFAEIDRHESFEDWPCPLMYKELLFRYGPDAKFS